MLRPEFEQLVTEYNEQRQSLKLMVEELEKVKEKVDRLFPETLNVKYVQFFQEKIKAVTELFKAILELRKEISKNIKDEIELRRKLDTEGDEDDNRIVDIRQLAKEIEGIHKSEGRIANG